MKKAIIICFFIVAALGSCTKKSTLDFFHSADAKLAIPITVSNLYASTTTGVPTVSTSMSGGGAITITLSIPAGTGRTIKQISKVAVAATTNNYTVVESSATPAYNSAPIAGGGTSVTFTTSLAEYTAKTAIAVTASGTATSFLTRYFYFLITLDNGEQIVPMPVRIYVAS